MPESTPARAVAPRLSVAARLRNYFFAGILVTAPISITVYFTWSVVTWVDDVVGRVLPPDYNPNHYLHQSVPGLGLLMLVTFLTAVGFLTTNFLGRSLVRLGERLLVRMPIVRSIYSAVKQIFETILKDQSAAFREVVLIEFPHTGMWTLALVVGRTEGELHERLPEEMVTVYVPTSPNPTSGYLAFVPRADAIRLDVSVEDALKMVVSSGLVTPGARPRLG